MKKKKRQRPLLNAEFLISQPKTITSIKSKYPSTMSSNFLEHIITTFFR